MTGQEHNLTQNNSSVNGTDDREARSKFWIAAYTRPRTEKKAAAELTGLGIESFVPVQKQKRLWSDRIKLVEIPIIPMIIFVRTTEEDIPIIKTHHLITKILTYPGGKKPGRIPDLEMSNLTRLLNQSEFPVAFKFGTYNTYDTVRIIRGNLKGVTGQIKEISKDTSSVWISVSLLGGSIIKINNADLVKTSHDNT